MSEKLSSAVAEVVKRLMAEQRLSANALAKLTGIPQTTVYRKVNGKQAMDLDDMEPFALALGLSVTQLLERAVAVTLQD